MNYSMVLDGVKYLKLVFISNVFNLFGNVNFFIKCVKWLIKFFFWIFNIIFFL